MMQGGEIDADTGLPRPRADLPLRRAHEQDGRLLALYKLTLTARAGNIPGSPRD
jgi:hypothetical protein